MNIGRRKCNAINLQSSQLLNTIKSHQSLEIKSVGLMCWGTSLAVEISKHNAQKPAGFSDKLQPS